MRLLLSLSSGALAALVFVTGCHRKQPPTADHPRAFPGVASRDVTFHSSVLDRNMTYRVYSPADMHAGTRLFVIYLLHGCGGSFRDWSNNSDVGSYATKDVALVMVDGDCSYYMNAARRSRERYEDYLVDEVIPDAESRFPIWPDRAHRAVVGVSMGGFAAVELALTRPNLFSFAGAISPAIDVPSRRFSFRRWQQSMRFRFIFGPIGSEARSSRDPFVLVKSADPARTPYLYITSGTDEPLLGPIRRFVVLLHRRHYSYEFHTRPGAHDWNQWTNQIPGCFESLFSRMSRPGSDSKGLSN